MKDNDVYNSLYEILQGVNSGDERYEVHDREHVLDTYTGIMFHLYDDKPLKVAMDSEVIMVQDNFTSHEQQLLQKVKNLIVEAVNDHRRNKFVNLFKSAQEMKKTDNEMPNLSPAKVKITPNGM